jgi:hypothetical protein
MVGSRRGLTHSGYCFRIPAECRTIGHEGFRCYTPRVWRSSPDVSSRGRIAAVSLIIAAFAFGWTTLLLVTGGFDLTIFGLTVTTHNFRRPAAAGIVALTLFVWAYGIRRLTRQAAWFGRASNQWLAQRRIVVRPIVLALGAAVLCFGIGWGTGIAGGSDSYGYLSQAELWLDGLPIVPQPWTADVPWPSADWTFTPLGYRPASGGGAIVPTYAVGLPLLMAAVKSLAGHAAMFWIGPVAGAMLVLVTYAVSRRLGSSAAGLIGAWLVATNATLLSEVTAPMSDVLAAAGLASSYYLLWSPARGRQVAAGLLSGLALLVRPNLAPTVGVMMLWLGVRSSGRGRAAQLVSVLGFAVAASPGFLVPAWANRRLYGSPLMSGYGNLESIYDWSNVLTNLRQYPMLMFESHAALALVGFAAVLAPVRPLWPQVTDRSLLVGIALFVFSLVGQYLAYEPATGGGYLRFLLPCWPFVMVGVAQVVLLPSRPGWSGAVVGLAILAYGVNSVYRLSQQGGFDQRSERKYPESAALVRSRTDPKSVIFSMQHSGSIRYYAGRITLRYDLLNEAWLDRSVAWLAAHGAHPYALLDDWEVKEFRRRFAGQRRLAQLDTPVFIYQGAVAVHFYDLLRPSGEGQPTETIVDRFDNSGYARPVRLPQFQFER